MYGNIIHKHETYIQINSDIYTLTDHKHIYIWFWTGVAIPTKRFSCRKTDMIKKKNVTSPFTITPNLSPRVYKLCISLLYVGTYYLHSNVDI